MHLTKNPFNSFEGLSVDMKGNKQAAASIFFFKNKIPKMAASQNHIRNVIIYASIKIKTKFFSALVWIFKKMADNSCLFREIYSGWWWWWWWLTHMDENERNDGARNKKPIDVNDGLSVPLAFKTNTIRGVLGAHWLDSCAITVLANKKSLSK